MAVLGPGYVAGPYPLKEPSFSLLNSAATPRRPDGSDDPDGRRSDVLGLDGRLPAWVAQVSWLPEPAATGNVHVDPPLTPTTFTPAIAAALRTVVPVLLTTGDRITAMQANGVDLPGRVVRQIKAASHPVLGAEFWAGAVQAANANLNDATVDVTPAGSPGGGASPLRILAELEGALGANGYGCDGMIHAERRLVTEWIANYDVEKVGNQLVTKLGTIIVADPGYPGTGPSSGGNAGGITNASATSYAYATDIVTAWASPIFLVPDTAQDGDGYGLTADVNTVTYRANRVLAAGWDGRRLFVGKALLPA